MYHNTKPVVIIIFSQRRESRESLRDIMKERYSNDNPGMTNFRQLFLFTQGQSILGSAILHRDLMDT